MKNFKLAAAAILGVSATAATADSLYYVGDETQESSPLKYVAGVSFIYDDNATPTVPSGQPGHEDEAFSVNPYVGATFTNVSPQSTLEVYARLGLIYYFDDLEAQNTDDVYTQARLGVNFLHNFNERLRFSSRNFISYELEPDYSYAVSTSRQTGEYLYWNSDNAVGYRFTERFGTYTGFVFSGLTYDDVSNQDRITWEVYEQLRYQYAPQTVLLGEYRYADTSANDDVSDSSSHYLSVGAEHRFSPNTTGIVKVGAQWYEVDGGEDNVGPYAEIGLNSRINSQLNVRSFLRYSIEPYNSVLSVGNDSFEFDDHPVLRVGVNGEYTLSPAVTLFGGVNYIHSNYDDGRDLATGNSVSGSVDEDLVNLYIGASVKVVENVYANASYNFTWSDSDVETNDYNRNQVTIGLRTEF